MIGQCSAGAQALRSAAASSAAPRPPDRSRVARTGGRSERTSPSRTHGCAASTSRSLVNPLVMRLADWCTWFCLQGGERRQERQRWAGRDSQPGTTRSQAAAQVPGPPLHRTALPLRPAHLERHAVVGGLGDGRQLLPGRRRPHKDAPAALGHAKVAGRRHAHAHLPGVKGEGRAAGGQARAGVEPASGESRPVCRRPAPAGSAVPTKPCAAAPPETGLCRALSRALSWALKMGHAALQAEPELPRQLTW